MSVQYERLTDAEVCELHQLRAQLHAANLAERSILKKNVGPVDHLVGPHRAEWMEAKNLCNRLESALMSLTFKGCRIGIEE